jgi:hypothetical protein
MISNRARIQSFRQFIDETSLSPGDLLEHASRRPNLMLSGQERPTSAAIPATQSMLSRKSVDQQLPALMTFQRKEVRMFADGRAVGLYRELRTGVEMVFPQNI